MTTIEVKNDYMLGRQNINILYYKCMELEQENKQLKERNKEIYDGFMVAIDEVCETDREKRKYKERIDKAIEYGKSCINEDLDVDKLDEEYKDIFKIAYEIHKHYLEILGDKENE